MEGFPLDIGPVDEGTLETSELDVFQLEEGPCEDAGAIDGLSPDVEPLDKGAVEGFPVEGDE